MQLLHVLFSTYWEDISWGAPSQRNEPMQSLVETEPFLLRQMDTQLDKLGWKGLTNIQTSLMTFWLGDDQLLLAADNP